MRSAKIIYLTTNVTMTCLLLVATCTSQTKIPNEEITHKVEELTKALNKLGPFSGAILIARDGKVLVSRGYGMANLEYEVANTPQTRFRLASVTKPFTATAIMLLQERGKLNVQDSVCKYVSSCPEAWQKITIHHLLTHTSGIPNESNFPDDRPETSSSIAADLVGRLKERPLEFPPGERYEYSNSGYILLGYIIESVSGESYEDFMRGQVFAPLQMTHSGFDHPWMILKDRADGYIWTGKQFINALDMSNPYAAGGLYSTIGDLFLFDQAVYTGRLLSKKSVDAMLTPFKNGYGYGWKIGTQFNRRVVSHDGVLEGFRANIVRFPDDRTCVIFLSNIGNTRFDEITQYLSAIALGEKYNLSELASPVTQTPVEVSTKVDPKIYDAYVGQYDLPMGVFTITVEDGKLMGQAAGEPSKAELLPKSPTEFFIQGPGEVKVSFVTNNSGQVTHISVLFRGREFQGKKIK